jgi:hypothetical protein
VFDVKVVEFKFGLMVIKQLIILKKMIRLKEQELLLCKFMLVETQVKYGTKIYILKS